MVFSHFGQFYAIYITTVLHMASDITDAAVTFDNGMAAPVPNPETEYEENTSFHDRVGGPAEPLGTGKYVMIRTYVTP